MQDTKDNQLIDGVLEQVEVFASNSEDISYSDYKVFKHKLQDNGIYGYESEIARILGL